MLGHSDIYLKFSRIGLNYTAGIHSRAEDGGRLLLIDSLNIQDGFMYFY